jgi:peptidoglycan/xylan/chitin deacetylase (PgdA/CDA1 family)
MYHALWRGLDAPAAIEAGWAADPQLREPGARLYALDHRDFERQMQAIATAGRQTPGDWADLDALSGASAISITFDDGHRSNHELALPVLQRHGLRGIFFITTDWIGTDGFMSAGQLRDLRRSGMLLGTHGCSHAYFSDLEEDALRRELVESKARLEGILGEPVPAVALPGGRNHPAIAELARQAGYRHVFTSRIAQARAGGDPLDWPRIPITHRQPADFISRLLAGDTTLIEAMAKSERRRAMAKKVLGNALYDRLRGWVLKSG